MSDKENPIRFYNRHSIETSNPQSVQSIHGSRDLSPERPTRLGSVNTPTSQARLLKQRQKQRTQLMLPISTPPISTQPETGVAALSLNVTQELDNFLASQARELQLRLQESDMKNAQLQEKLKNIESELEHTRKQHAIKSNQGSRLDDELWNLQVQNQQFRDQITDFDATIFKLKNEAKTLRARNQTLNEQLEQAKHQEQSLLETQEKLKQKLEIESARYRRTQGTLLREKSDLGRVLDDLKRENETLKTRPLRTRSKIPVLNRDPRLKDQVDADEPIQDMIKALETSPSQKNKTGETTISDPLLLETLRNTLQKAQQDIDSLQSEKRALEQHLVESQQKITDLQNELEEKEDVIREHTFMEQSMAMEFNPAEEARDSLFFEVSQFNTSQVTSPKKDVVENEDEDVEGRNLLQDFLDSSLQSAEPVKESRSALELDRRDSIDLVADELDESEISLYSNELEVSDDSDVEEKRTLLCLFPKRLLFCSTQSNDASK